ncbi:MAG: ABC-2 transporter permease [Thermoanaerobaculia bacterium]
MIAATVVVETLRRRWSSVYFWVFVAAVLTFGLPFVVLGESAEAGLAWAMLALFLGAELFGPEASAGSLHLALARPIRRSTYVLARYAGVLLCAWSVVAVAAVASLVTALLTDTPIAWDPFFEAVMESASNLLFGIAMIGLFGTFTTSYANVLLFIFYAVAVGSLAEPMARWAPRFHAYVWPELMPQVEAGVLAGHLTAISNTLVVLFLACLVMNRRQLPYGRE